MGQCFSVLTDLEQFLGARSAVHEVASAIHREFNQSSKRQYFHYSFPSKRKYLIAVTLYHTSKKAAAQFSLACTSAFDFIQALLA
jgi:hypothetical protein